jgi:hypothetical protein
MKSIREIFNPVSKFPVDHQNWLKEKKYGLQVLTIISALLLALLAADIMLHYQLGHLTISQGSPDGGPPPYFM